MAAGLRGPKLELWCTICDDLRVLHDRRNSFCTLTVKETDEGERATVARFERILAVVTGSSDGPPVTRTGRTDSPRSPLAPLCFNFSGRR
jgi:hypothetical protein